MTIYEEKYGFVYIWYDRKHKRYYVGSHWGSEDDGYICSSRWMRKSYKRRPEDFTRRILKKINTSRQDLYEEETRYLNMIKPEEIKVRYYNLNIKSAAHWSAIPDRHLSIKEKIAKNTKKAMQRDDVRKNFEKGLLTRDCRSSDLEVREKRKKSMLGKNTGPRHPNTLAAVTNAAKVKRKCKYCDYVGIRLVLGRYHDEKCKKKI